MRILRVSYNDQVFYGALLQKEPGEESGPGAGLEIQCLNKELGFNDPIPLQSVAVLPPVAPTKIICVGLNYRKHAEEMGKETPEEPVLFLKPPSAVISSGQPIIMPNQAERVDFEGELAIIFGRPGKHIKQEEAAEYVFGYACANDVTARDLQSKDGQYGRAKGFDTFAPIGPWIETQVTDPGNLGLRTFVNGEVKQESTTADMLFSPLDLICYVSSVMTVFPGDVILTGTPSGIGPLKAGDEVRVEIDEVGTLINPVIQEGDSEGQPLQ